MSIFVIMYDEGEYSDYSVNVVGYVTDEETAQKVVVDLTNKHKMQYAEDWLKDDLRSEGMREFAIKNPAPNFPNERPIFDRSRAKEKGYQKAYTEAKHKFEHDYGIWVRNEMTKWYKDLAEYGTAYADDHFDPSKVKMPESMPTFSYFYQSVDELKV